jgi:hypothetical protein
VKTYFSNKLESLEEMDKFLDAFDLPKLNQEDISHLNRFIISNVIEALIKERSGPSEFTPKFSHTFKEE